MRMGRCSDQPKSQWLVFSAILVSLGTSRALAEPTHGDVYREYTYSNTYGDAGGSIRVGGKKGVSYPDRGSDFGYVNAWIEFPHELDLEHAIRAEVVVEKILSHNGTHGFAIQWNEQDWIALPAPDAIPDPKRDYYHHTCIEQPVDLEGLKAERNANRFRLKVNPEQDWNWPQHLAYGVHLRIYYDPAAKTHPKGKLAPIQDGKIGRSATLGVVIDQRDRRVNRVDYLANYRGVNWAGDGIERRWQYFYYHGNLIHHVGSSVTAPFNVKWDTSWIPDQSQPIAVAARIIDDTGLIYLTPAAEPLTIDRPDFSVELCMPTEVPSNWVTRSKEYQESIEIKGDVESVTAARLCWSSWSPGYMNGIFVNGHKVIQSEGPRYRYFDHRVPINDLSILKPGTNTISTGKTPLHDGKMVHGMEVNWPGIQLLLQRDQSEAAK